MSQIDLISARHAHSGVVAAGCASLEQITNGRSDELLQTNQPAGLSALSLRETAFMIQRERLEVDASLDAWLDSIDSHPLLTILPLTAKIAAESVRLGDDSIMTPPIKSSLQRPAVTTSHS